MTRPFYTGILSEKAPIYTAIARAISEIRLNATEWSKYFRFMAIISAGTPPTVLPTTSNVLNYPTIKILFQSSESMKVMGFAWSTPGKTKNDKAMPKKTWNSMGQAVYKAKRELVHRAVIAVFASPLSSFYFPIELANPM